MDKEDRTSIVVMTSHLKGPFVENIAEEYLESLLYSKDPKDARKETSNIIRVVCIRQFFAY